MQRAAVVETAAKRYPARVILLTAKSYATEFKLQGQWISKPDHRERKGHKRHEIE